MFSMSMKTEELNGRTDLLALEGKGDSKGCYKRLWAPLKLFKSGFDPSERILFHPGRISARRRLLNLRWAHTGYWYEMSIARPGFAQEDPSLGGDLAKEILLLSVQRVFPRLSGHST